MPKNNSPQFNVVPQRHLDEAEVNKERALLDNHSNYALRKALTEMHDALKKDKNIFRTDLDTGKIQVKDLIDKTIIQESANLYGVKSYSNQYSKLLLDNNKFKEEVRPDYQALSAAGKTKYQAERKIETINVIIFIFYKYGGYILDEKAARLRLGTVEIELNNPLLSDSETHTYLLRYWRTYLNYETEETVGTFYLTINYVMPKATLENANGDTFDGHITEYSSLRDGRMISIIFSAPNIQTGQTFSLFFHKSSNETFQNYIWASFAKERRQVASAVTSGLAYLETYENDKDQWKNSQPSAEIAYLLRRKRFDTKQPIYGDEKGIAAYPTQLHRFQGIYRGNLIKISRQGLSFETNIVVIRNDGLVVIYTNNSQHFPDIVYAGSCTVVNVQSKHFAAINYDINNKEQALKKDFHKFSILLKEENPYRNKPAIQYLIGIRTGISLSDNNPIATKICLENINEELKTELTHTFKKTDDKADTVLLTETYLSKLIQLFFLKDNDQIESDENSKLLDLKRKLIKNLNPIDITNNPVDEKTALNYFQGKPFLKKFFIDDYGSLTDTNAIIKLKSSMKSNVPSGNYDCYSFSLEGNKPVLTDTNVAHERIKKYPIHIESNGKAKIKIHQDVYDGKVTYHEDRQELTLLFYIEVAGKSADLFENPVFFTCMFNVPKDALSHKNTSFRLSGTLQKKIRGKHTVESRVCVLSLASKAFLKNPYEDFIYFDSFAFRHRDKITGGILSHLTGPINRISRAEANLNYLHPRSEVNSFKIDLFYSACYIATLIKNESTNEYDYSQVVQRLFQAYVHGFAQTHYRGIAVDSSIPDNNIDNLKKEINLLRKAIQEGGPLSDPNLKAWINRRWFSAGDKKTLLGFLSSEESTQYTIVTPFQQQKKHIFRSDEITAEVIVDLFSYYGFDKPNSVQANKLSESPSGNYYISVGLFSNLHSMQINDQEEPIKNGRYFKLVDGGHPRKHTVRIMNAIDGNMNDNEDSWPVYSLEDDIEDYAIIAKVNYGSIKTIIVGGLNIEGTEAVGDYLESNWQNLLEWTDLETRTSILDSDNFVCLLSLSKMGIIRQVAVRAISISQKF